MTLQTELPRKLVVKDDVWSALLRLKTGDGTAGAFAAEPAWALYAAIAGADHMVLAQVGQSLDGRIAARSGDAAEISGPEGFVHLHRCRALVDAVIIGVGTAVSDDPSLTVRLVEGDDPVRVVVDPAGRMPAGASMLSDGGGRVIIVHGEGCPPQADAETIALALGENGIEPSAILEALRARGLRRLLVEGGPRTVRNFVARGLADRLHVAVSPIIIGSGPTGIELPPIATMDHALRPQVSVHHLGSDVLFDCDLARADGGSAAKMS